MENRSKVNEDKEEKDNSVIEEYILKAISNPYDRNVIIDLENGKSEAQSAAALQRKVSGEFSEDSKAKKIPTVFINYKDFKPEIPLEKDGITRLYVIGHGTKYHPTTISSGKDLVKVETLADQLAKYIQLNKHVVVNLISCEAANSLENSFAAKLHKTLNQKLRDVYGREDDVPVIARTEKISMSGQYVGGGAKETLKITSEKDRKLHEELEEKLLKLYDEWIKWVKVIESMPEEKQNKQKEKNKQKDEDYRSRLINIELSMSKIAKSHFHSKYPGSKLVFFTHNGTQYIGDVYKLQWRKDLMKVLDACMRNTFVIEKINFLNAWKTEFASLTKDAIRKKIENELDDPNSVIRQHSSFFKFGQTNTQRQMVRLLEKLNEVDSIEEGAVKKIKIG